MWGTHVQATGEIGSFKILSESSSAAGVRRIEAITGENVLNYLNTGEKMIREAAELLKTTPDNLLEKIASLLKLEKEQEKIISALKDKLAGSTIDGLPEKAREINGVRLLTAQFEGLDNEGLLKLSDQLKQKIDSGIVVLASRLNGKALFVATVSKDLIQKGYNAGKIVGAAARITGGGGGGRPDLAQAGGRDCSKLDEALAEVERIISTKFS